MHPFLGLIPADVEWRLQPEEVVRVLTPSVEALGDPAERRRLPFTSSYFREPLEVDGIDVEGHVLWGMTLRLLDDLVPRLLAGEVEARLRKHAPEAHTACLRASDDSLLRYPSSGSGPTSSMPYSWHAWRICDPSTETFGFRPPGSDGTVIAR